VSRGWLGVLIQDVTTELAESFHMSRPYGALVSKVLPDSPAQQAGIEAGDVITKFNGQSITTSSDLPPLVGTAEVNKKIPVEIMREGKTKTLTITIGALPAEDEVPLAGKSEPDKTPGISDTRLKITVRDLTSEERKELSVSGPGVLVEEVKAGPAREAGLRPGDVLVQINFKEITSAAALNDITAPLTAGDKVPVLVNRQGNPLFMPLELPK